MLGRGCPPMPGNRRRSLVLGRGEQGGGMHANEQVRAANVRAAACTCQPGPALSSGDFHPAALWAKAGGPPSAGGSSVRVWRTRLQPVHSKGLRGCHPAAAGERCSLHSAHPAKLASPTRAPHCRKATKPEVRHSQTRTIKCSPSHSFC